MTLSHVIARSISGWQEHARLFPTCRSGHHPTHTQKRKRKKGLFYALLSSRKESSQVRENTEQTLCFLKPHFPSGLSIVVWWLCGNKIVFFPPLPFAALYTTEERGDFPMCYRIIQPPSAQVGEQQILFSEDLSRNRAGFKRRVLHAHKEIVKPHTVSINGNSFSFWHDRCTHCSLTCNRPILTTQEWKRRQGSD